MRAAASKFKCSAGFRHLALQPRQQRLLLAFEEEHDLVDRPIVILLGLIADARRQAALDVVLQARALAPAVDRLAAGPQRKDQTHQVDQLAQPVRVRVRPEVARPVVADHAREDDPRKRLVGDLQIGIAFVVAQTDVERRLMPLDQVRLEDQRLDLVGDDDRSNVGDLLDHRRRARVVRRALLEIRPHAIAQRDRLSDVENLAVASDHQIHARRVRDLREVLERRHPAPTGRRARTTTMTTTTASDGDAEHDVGAAMQQREHVVEMRAERVPEQDQSAAENERAEERPQIKQREVHLGDARPESRRCRARPARTGRRRSRNVPHRSKKRCTTQQPLVRDVDVLPVAFDERHAAEAPDGVAERAARQLADERHDDREPQAAQVAGRHQSPRRGQEQSRCRSARRDYPSARPTNRPKYP